MLVQNVKLYSNLGIVIAGLLSSRIIREIKKVQGAGYNTTIGLSRHSWLFPDHYHLRRWGLWTKSGRNRTQGTPTGLYKRPGWNMLSGYILWTSLSWSPKSRHYGLCHPNRPRLLCCLIMIKILKNKSRGDVCIVTSLPTKTLTGTRVAVGNFLRKTVRIATWWWLIAS